MGNVHFNTDVDKNVDINKNVNVNVNKNVQTNVDLNGSLASAEASADAVGGRRWRGRWRDRPSTSCSTEAADLQTTTANFGFTANDGVAPAAANFATFADPTTLFNIQFPNGQTFNGHQTSQLVFAHLILASFRLRLTRRVRPTSEVGRIKGDGDSVAARVQQRR